MKILLLLLAALFSCCSAVGIEHSHYDMVLDQRSPHFEQLRAKLRAKLREIGVPDLSLTEEGEKKFVSAMQEADIHKKPPTGDAAFLQRMSASDPDFDHDWFANDDDVLPFDSSRGHHVSKVYNPAGGVVSDEHIFRAHNGTRLHHSHDPFRHLSHFHGKRSMVHQQQQQQQQHSTQRGGITWKALDRSGMRYTTRQGCTQLDVPTPFVGVNQMSIGLNFQTESEDKPKGEGYYGLVGELSFGVEFGLKMLPKFTVYATLQATFESENFQYALIDAEKGTGPATRTNLGRALYLLMADTVTFISSDRAVANKKMNQLMRKMSGATGQLAEVDEMLAQMNKYPAGPSNAVGLRNPMTRFAVASRLAFAQWFKGVKRIKTDKTEYQVRMATPRFFSSATSFPTTEKSKIEFADLLDDITEHLRTGKPEHFKALHAQTSEYVLGLVRYLYGRLMDEKVWWGGKHMHGDHTEGDDAEDAGGPSADCLNVPGNQVITDELHHWSPFYQRNIRLHSRLKCLLLSSKIADSENDAPLTTRPAVTSTFFTPAFSEQVVTVAENRGGGGSDLQWQGPVTTLRVHPSAANLHPSLYKDLRKHFNAISAEGGGDSFDANKAHLHLDKLRQNWAKFVKFFQDDWPQMKGTDWSAEFAQGGPNMAAIRLLNDLNTFVMSEFHQKPSGTAISRLEATKQHILDDLSKVQEAVKEAVAVSAFPEVVKLSYGLVIGFTAGSSGVGFCTPDSNMVQGTTYAKISKEINPGLGFSDTQVVAGANVVFHPIDQLGFSMGYEYSSGSSHEITISIVAYPPAPAMQWASEAVAEQMLDEYGKNQQGDATSQALVTTMVNTFQTFFGSTDIPFGQSLKAVKKVLISLGKAKLMSELNKFPVPIGRTSTMRTILQLDLSFKYEAGAWAVTFQSGASVGNLVEYKLGFPGMQGLVYTFKGKTIDLKDLSNVGLVVTKGVVKGVAKATASAGKALNPAMTTVVKDGATTLGALVTGYLDKKVKALQAAKKKPISEKEKLEDHLSQDDHLVDDATLACKWAVYLYKQAMQQKSLQCPKTAGAELDACVGRKSALEESYQIQRTGSIDKFFSADGWKSVKARWEPKCKARHPTDTPPWNQCQSPVEMAVEDGTGTSCLDNPLLLARFLKDDTGNAGSTEKSKAGSKKKVSGGTTVFTGELD